MEMPEGYKKLKKYFEAYEGEDFDRCYFQPEDLYVSEIAPVLEHLKAMTSALEDFEYAHWGDAVNFDKAHEALKKFREWK